jgi:hypothetical protein
MATLRKRLDVYIKAELRNYIAEESERTGHPMNAITDELLTFAIAYKRGKMIEQQALPMISEVLRRHKAELRAELREDLVDTLREATCKSTERIITLVTRTIRDASTTKRLIYAFIARTCSPEFARETYEDVREQVGLEGLFRRVDGCSVRENNESYSLMKEEISTVPSGENNR